MIDYQARQIDPAEGSRETIDTALSNEAAKPVLTKKPAQNLGDLERIVSAAVGLKLAAMALKRIGLTNLLISGLGIGLLSRAGSGHCAIKEKYFS